MFLKLVLLDIHGNEHIIDQTSHEQARAQFRQACKDERFVRVGLWKTFVEVMNHDRRTDVREESSNAQLPASSEQGT